MEKWTHPRDYGGFSPEGDFGVYSQHRDSNALTRSNYECIFRDLKEFAKKFLEPEDNPDIESGDIGSWVYDFRAGHWAVGWVEYILIRQDAPQEIIDKGDEILAEISDYLVYDESHYYELEWDEATEYWGSLPIDERVDLCKEHNLSIFSARRDYIPPNDDGSLYDYLITP
jgi:hypothetical protein